MNEKIMKKLGLGEMASLVKQGKCPFCKEIVNRKDFRNRLSRKEHRISGLCQKCQDRVFGNGGNI